tara:strand:+ start:48 stop:347 length:300 start_codon:yes stop_codon:yes gene_type:complete
MMKPINLSRSSWIKEELTKRIGASQECGEAGFVLDTSKLTKKGDFLSLFLRDAIENADEPYDVYHSIQYALGQLNYAAFAASEYGDELAGSEDSDTDRL